jgi:hypothetical protein
MKKKYGDVTSNITFQENEQIKRNFYNDINKTKFNKKKDELETRYKFLVKIDVQKNNKLKCCALTTSYERCKQKPAYIYECMRCYSIVTRIDDISQKNAIFCLKHTKALIESNDMETLKYGFYWESDIYS